ncbi:BatA domain-containing protein [Pedobacter sandarakinus]|uniref:BatA domain-containing protein n=1 Tax=Pedobacter sandarakinus TaxID=353156 RepID=UPI002246F375|nr:BatA domain-containing protein [Pedobacter sandarakinus]MCX2573892.1 BatA domain-containing protein [Pedobacter sandarakinus]
MQFLYPIGFFALAGVIIPLIIHLWNIKKGKTLKIASIALLGEDAPASAKSFKLNEILLLVLRVLLLVLVAFIISKPFLIKKPLENKPGWILVPAANFPAVYRDHRQKIDSLLRTGYEIHDFNPQFKALGLADTVIKTISRNNSVDMVNLLAQLNTKLSTGKSAYLFADNSLNQIGSDLPKIGYALHWENTYRGDTSSTWIADFAGKKYEARSSALGTSYKALNGNDELPIKVAIYEPPGRADGRYLIAALKAIGSYTGRRILINPTGKVNLGFWLADVPAAESFKSNIDTGGKLFQYETGKVSSVFSTVQVDGTEVNLEKRVTAPAHPSAMLDDGFGNPILVRDSLNELTIFRFYSRLNPQWGDLVWRETFINFLMPMVLPQSQHEHFGFEDNKNDLRRATIAAEDFPKQNVKIIAREENSTQEVDYIFWFIAWLILMIERILSFRKKTGTYVKN